MLSGDYSEKSAQKKSQSLENRLISIFFDGEFNYQTLC